MRKTIKTIAEELGISKTTVSLALNGQARKVGISKETEKKILEYCHANNYVANVHAQKIRNHMAKNIGAVIWAEHWQVAIEEKYCSHMILEGICLEAKKHNFSVSMLLMSDKDNMGDLLKRYFSQELDGFIFYGFAMSRIWNSELKKHKVPTAIIGGNPEDGLPTVNLNNCEMSFELTKKLIEGRRRSFVFIPGDETSYLNSERLRGCREALKAISHEPVVLPDCRFKRELAYKRLSEHIDKCGACFDAVVCASDAMALGAKQALDENGINIPKDAALTGGDMNEYIRQGISGIATYPTLPEEQGRKAFELLLRQLKKKSGPKHFTLKSKIIWKT